MSDEPVVVDASALAALIFGESRAQEMAERLGDRPLVAPSLLHYELASVCLKKVSDHPDQRDALTQALAWVDRMDLRLVTPPIQGIAEIAAATGLTAYDAAYLWLARRLGSSLVTLDRRLARYARSGG